jgi:hypothetical protein
MTVEQLVEIVTSHEAQGLDLAVLRRPCGKKRYRTNAAILPGLNGRIVSHEHTSLTIMFSVPDLRRWLARRDVVIPYAR